MTTQKVLNYDVVIVGAGVAGISAGIICARNNLRTLIVEKNSFIGGSAVAAMHNFLCGLYPQAKTFPKKNLNSSLAVEIQDRLRKLDASSKIIQKGKVWVLSFNPEIFSKCFDNLIAEHKNLEVFLNSSMVLVKKTNKQIKEIQIKKNNTNFAVFPKAVIDCSGEAVVSKLAKIKFYKIKVTQQPLSGFTIKVINVKKDVMLAYKLLYFLNTLVSARKIKKYFKFTNFADLGNNEVLIKFNFPQNFQYSQAKQEVLGVFKLIQKNLDCFKQSKIKFISPELAHRQQDMMVGQYTLTQQDVLKSKKFSDAVVKANWPIEFWDKNKGPQYKYLAENEYYEIPAGCLKSKFVDNLYAAGRCISAAPEALASARVMGSCIALGEQAALAVLKEI